MEVTNSFSKGMFKDLSPLNQDKNSYIHAENIRIINDVSGTSISINNIRGNDFNITIPDIPVFQRIDITSPAAGQTLSINGQTGLVFSTVGMTPQDLYNYIINSGSYTLLGTEYNIYVGNSYLVITPISPFVLTVSQPAGTSLTINTSFIPAQTDLEIIGSTTIRDDVYLFTTSNTTKNPGGHSFDSSLPVDPSSVGQIWKYTYDKITLAGTLTLVYNNFTDFSTYYCIAPSAALGRYENNSTQRLYWTDNYNKLRSLNVADPNSIAIDITLLDIIPAVDFDIPIMNNISSAPGTANVQVGVWQIAYRLKNTGGAVTAYSPLSDMVYITAVNDSAAIIGSVWKFYHGASKGTTTTKSVTWTISNIDLDFDRIEVVLLMRYDNIDIPADIVKVYEGPIEDNESLDVTINGTIINNGTPITLEEFLTLSGVFTHCKTIGSKDNRLFVGNVRNQFSDLTYDARAFRAKTSGGNDIYLTNSGTQTLYNLATAEALAETEDAINDYDNANAGYYKPGTAILGGEGTNISYEFISIATAADKSTQLTDCVPAPFFYTDPEYGLPNEVNLNVISTSNDGVDVLQEHNKAFPSILCDGIKFPPLNSFYVGYQANEIYRFGIQFYDKSKHPFFVKWIGDIKFPDYLQPCPAANHMYEDGTPTGFTVFNKIFTSATKNNVVFVTQLGIKFDISIPANISELISGYSIVRVRRKEEDKTVISEGIISNFATGGSSPWNIGSQAMNYVDGSLPNYQLAFFLTPDELNLKLASPTAGMRFKSSTYLDNTSAVTAINPDCTRSVSPYYMYKMFSEASLTSAGHATEDKNISFALLMDSANSYAVPLGGIVQNFNSIGSGNRVYYLEFTAPLNASAAPFGANSRKYFGYIYRTLTSQYGGNTYTQRSNNDYILCSHYRKTITSAVTINDSPYIYGGDVTTGLMDDQRLSKDTANLAGTTSTTFFYPATSPVNRELRHGNHVNFALITEVDIGWDGRDEYFYNPVYSAQNDIVKFIPKPDPFLLNEEFDNRFHASEIKINGEFVDSWGIFLPNNYWDVEGIYGPINAMSILKDKMYFWQDRAFGIIQINPRTIITDVNSVTNSDLNVGSGLPLQRHDYLSTEIGCQHQWGITKSSYKLFWMDVNNKKFFAFGGEGIAQESDIKGMFSWFSNNLQFNINNIDKPVYEDALLGLNGIRSIYDFKYNQAIFTFTDSLTGESVPNNYTLVFDERLNVFTSFYSHTPKVYFSDGYKIFSNDPNNLSDIYIHDSGDYSSFYGTIYNSIVKLVVNDNPMYTKVFDNIMWDSQSTQLNGNGTYTNFNDDSWKTIRIYNDYQNTDTQALTIGTNIKRKERTWQLAIPRNRVLYTTSNSPNIFLSSELSTPNNKPFGERIRDKFIIIELTYDNLNNRLLSTNNLRCLYRISPR